MVRTISRGFTLIDLLVLIIILGVLAEIVIGPFRNTSRDACIDVTHDTVRQGNQAVARF